MDESNNTSIRNAGDTNGPDTAFMSGPNDRLTDLRIGAMSPANKVWGSDRMSGLTNATIMMVDDEQLNIDMTQALLMDTGYAHFISTDKAEEAVELMRTKLPSLLLLDLSMPKVSGMEILHIMRNDALLRHVPVIVLTMAQDPQVKLQALTLGAMDFLSKPVDPSELALRVRNTLAATLYRDYLAQHDPLTSLPNKLRYKEDVKAALARPDRNKRKGALIHIGVDHLGRVNDAMGHAVGDQLMQRISKRLASCVDAESAAAPGGLEDRCALYRFDGDEFAVLLPGMENVTTAASFINRLLDAAATTFNRGGTQEIFVTCSIGVAVFPDDGCEVDILVTNAGLAMRDAKRAGRHTYEFFAADLNEKAVRSLNRGADLRIAFTRNQVELLYQPRVHTGAGTLTGAQAVPRWHHPTGEVFEGDALLDMAVTPEMSMALTEWMLQQVGEETRKWRAADLSPPRVGVTIGLAKISMAQVCDALRDAIRGGLQPQYLAVEFRGGGAIDLAAPDLEALVGFKKMGVRFVLDWFGGPDAPLLQLRQLPYSEVKMHPLFFQLTGTSSNSASLVAATVGMTRNLGLRCVATGIENTDQVALLQGNLCDEYQGPLVGAAVAAPTFANSWLVAQNRQGS